MNWLKCVSGYFSVGFVHKHFEVENKIKQESQFLFLLSLLPKVRSTLKIKISIFEGPAFIDRSNGQFPIKKFSFFSQITVMSCYNRQQLCSKFILFQSQLSPNDCYSTKYFTRITPKLELNEISADYQNHYEHGYDRKGNKIKTKNNLKSIRFVRKVILGCPWLESGRILKSDR